MFVLAFQNLLILRLLLCNSLHCCSQLLITVVVVCGNDPERETWEQNINDSLPPNKYKCKYSAEMLMLRPAFSKSLLLHNLQFFVAASSSNHINPKGRAQLFNMLMTMNYYWP